MTKYLLLLSLLFFTGIELNAQTYNGTGGIIPDNGTTKDFSLPVSGIPITSLDTLYGLESVCISINHTYDNDLDIWLVAPDGTQIEISTGNGGSGQNYSGTCFNDGAQNIISGGTAPFNGNYRPEGHLYDANNGQNPNGTWKLRIHDTYPGADQGTLISWNFTLGNHPAIPFNFSSSNLPIVKITTNGQTIVDDPKIICNMEIIDNGAGIRNNVNDVPNAYNGFIGIEIRGSSSQQFPKKSYGFETSDNLGNEQDVSLLGLPAESDWILNANFSDKTLMRNVLSYQLSEAMGNYASRCRYVEVLIDGQYAGVYILMEKIKRDNNRVDISKLDSTDITGDKLTGGYILKIDKTTGSANTGWTSAYPAPNGGPNHSVLIEYPKTSDILNVQFDYIHSYVDTFENVLAGNQFTDPVNGYSKYIDVTSFADQFIINELSKNVDGYRISTYFYKKRDSKGGKLHMGPVWDYDIAWGNADYYDGSLSYGFMYPYPHPADGNQVPFWWGRLMQDTVFENAVRCRWENLRSNVLSVPFIYAKIDSMALLLDESQQRNFIEWPILGTYVWPNPSPIPATYAAEVVALKNWVSNRTAWLDNNLPGNCISTGIENNTAENSFIVRPVPVRDELKLNFTIQYTGNLQLEVYNLLGEEVFKSSYQKTSDTFQTIINLSAEKAGIYFVKISCDQRNYFRKIVKE